jgi:NADPH2:quinone reductase
MKAFIFERHGEPTDVLGLRDLPDPVPGPGEVLVRIRLSPVHPTDLQVLRERFGRQPTPPTSPGPSARDGKPLLDFTRILLLPDPSEEK